MRWSQTIQQEELLLLLFYGWSSLEVMTDYDGHNPTEGTRPTHSLAAGKLYLSDIMYLQPQATMLVPDSF